MNALPRGRHMGVCAVHRKCCYPSRRAAKAAVRDVREPGLREYRCTVTGLWHFGHLPQATVVGMKTAAEVYHPNPRRETK